VPLPLLAPLLAVLPAVLKLLSPQLRRRRKRVRLPTCKSVREHG